MGCVGIRVKRGRKEELLRGIPKEIAWKTQPKWEDNIKVDSKERENMDWTKRGTSCC